MQILLLAYVVFATFVFVVLMVLDLLSFRRMRGEEMPDGRYQPRALVIVPCKGKDITLYQNLKALKNQDYGRFRVIAVVDSKEDESLPEIRRAGLEWMLSTDKSSGASGKVRAILTALKRFRDFEVYAIADSDITVDRRWLQSLVFPLRNRNVGLSTMFPFFNPIKGFWSEVKCAWGFVGEGLMNNKATRFGWGGSLAFRKDLVDRKGLEFLGNSRYSVSDDVSLTKIAKSKNLELSYTRNSQPMVNCIESFSSFSEWSTRQTALSIMGYRRNLGYGLAFYSAEILVFVSAIILSIFVSALFAVFFLHLLQSEVKAYLRSRKRHAITFLIVILMPFIYLVNLVVASRKRSIMWRGKEYRIDQ